MSAPEPDDFPPAGSAVGPTDGQELKRDFRQTMITGAAITIPFFITLLVLAWAIDLVSNLVAPVVDLLAFLGPTTGVSNVLAEVASVLAILGLIFFVGLVAQRGPDQPHIGRRVDHVMGEIPGIGSIYTGINRLSEVLLESDTESFQEVKLVEFPHDETYVLGFQTADTPGSIEEAGGHDEMKTIFLPLAPNPVMGGHLVHLPDERIYDVDMEVEQGMQAIMTTGAAVDQELHEEEDMEA